MGSTYAYVYEGVVRQIIQPFISDSGEEVPIDKVYSVEFVDCCVEVTGLDPHPGEGWTFDGNVFAEPAPPPEQTPAQIRAANAIVRDGLLDTASRAIAPLQDALDLGIIETSEQALLTQWKTYRVNVNRVDLAQQAPAWPSPPVPPDYVSADPTS
jgi:hypothetical protein